MHAFSKFAPVAHRRDATARRRLQGRRNLLLLVSGATALTLTFGLAPEARVLNAAVASLAFNVLYDFIMAQGHKQYALCPYLDLANFSPASNTEVQYNYFDDGFVALLEEETLTNEQVRTDLLLHVSPLCGFCIASEASYGANDWRAADGLCRCMCTV